MIYAEKHLSLLSRMERDGLQLRFTGEFPEEILDQTCKKIEDMGLQEKLRKEEATQIQRELIQVPEFAELYQALCAHGVEVSVIHTMLQSARSYQEHLSQYPKEQVLGAAALSLKPSLKFEYMKHYQPLVRYEEEERAVADNLDTFPVLEWQEISPLTEHQRSMMRLPFLGAYLFNWHDHERETVELLEQNQPLQKILMMNYVRGVELFLDTDSMKNLKWLQMRDVEKFRRLMEAFEYDAEDLSEFWTLWLENRAGQYAAVSAREGHKGDIVQRGQLFEDTADCRPGQSPADSQFSVGNKRIAGAVAEIDHWPQV